MRRPLVIAGVVGASIGAVFATSLYVKQALRQPPPFYTAALSVDPQTLGQSSRSFERRVAALYSDVQLEEPWQAVFSQAEINGWLSDALPNKFPDLLPDGVQQPRIALDDGFLKLGFLYEGDGLESPVSVELEVFATDSDLLAVRFCSARAGSLPLPTGSIVQRVSQVAKKLDWAVRWTRFEGDPVALAPLRGLIYGENIRRELQSVSVVDGELVLTGSAVPLTAANIPLSNRPKVR